MSKLSPFQKEENPLDTKNWWEEHLITGERRNGILLFLGNYITFFGWALQRMVIWFKQIHRREEGCTWGVRGEGGTLHTQRCSPALPGATLSSPIRPQLWWHTLLSAGATLAQFCSGTFHPLMCVGVQRHTLCYGCPCKPLL